VDGNAQGAVGIGIFGRLVWKPAGGTAFAASQSQMNALVLPLLVGAGFGDVMNQIEPPIGETIQAVPPIDQHFVGTVSLIAGTTMGAYTVRWTSETNFFGVGYFSGVPPPSHTFTLIRSPRPRR
jgi:hypothetical protein